MIKKIKPLLDKIILLTSSTYFFLIKKKINNKVFKYQSYLNIGFRSQNG